MKPLIVGEAPNNSGRHTVPGVILSRLRPLSIPRRNLLLEWPGGQGKGSSFPLELAGEAARKLMRVTPRARPLILAGTRVARAFGLKRSQYEFLRWFEFRGRRIAVVPHPSGIVRWWNDPKNRAALERFLKDASTPKG